MADLGKVETEFENAARSFQAEVQSHANEAEREMRELQSSVDKGIEEAASAANVPAPAPRWSSPRRLRRSSSSISAKPWKRRTPEPAPPKQATG
jgi:hypothetical protein